MQTITLNSLKFELRNYMEHGRPQHKGDWYHQWARTSKGTLSWDQSATK